MLICELVNCDYFGVGVGVFGIVLGFICVGFFKGVIVF